MKPIASIFFFLFATTGLLSAQHPCADSARAQARRFLSFHGGGDDRVEIDREVKQLKPLKNPAGGGYLDVLEVWGYIYKAEYRMRFLYARIGEDCMLVGQEILEHVSLGSSGKNSRPTRR